MTPTPQEIEAVNKVLCAKGFVQQSSQELLIGIREYANLATRGPAVYGTLDYALRDAYDNRLALAALIFVPSTETETKTSVAFLAHGAQIRFLETQTFLERAASADSIQEVFGMAQALRPLSSTKYKNGNSVFFG